MSRRILLFTALFCLPAFSQSPLERILELVRKVEVVTNIGPTQQHLREIAGFPAAEILTAPAETRSQVVAGLQRRLRSLADFNPIERPVLLRALVVWGDTSPVIQDGLLEYLRLLPAPGLRSTLYTSYLLPALQLLDQLSEPHASTIEALAAFAQKTSLHATDKMEILSTISILAGRMTDRRQTGSEAYGQALNASAQGASELTTYFGSPDARGNREKMARAQTIQLTLCGLSEWQACSDPTPVDPSNLTILNALDLLKLLAPDPQTPVDRTAVLAELRNRAWNSLELQQIEGFRSSGVPGLQTVRELDEVLAHHIERLILISLAGPAPRTTPDAITRCLVDLLDLGKT